MPGHISENMRLSKLRRQYGTGMSDIEKIKNEHHTYERLVLGGINENCSQRDWWFHVCPNR